MSLTVSSAIADVPDRPAEDGAGTERAALYRLLAALLLGPPSGALLDALRRLEPSPDEAAAVAKGLQLLRLAGERAQVAALDDEYHALFIGIGRGELVPYGSWYLTGFLMDRPLATLRRDLAALGIERRADVREPEDHAAALCETMALLCTRSGSQAEAAQGEFFAAHVEPWLGVFFRDLQEAPSACFYRSVGYLGERFLEFERRYLALPA